MDDPQDDDDLLSKFAIWRWSREALIVVASIVFLVSLITLPNWLIFIELIYYGF